VDRADEKFASSVFVAIIPRRLPNAVSRPTESHLRLQMETIPIARMRAPDVVAFNNFPVPPSDDETPAPRETMNAKSLALIILSVASSLASAQPVSPQAGTAPSWVTNSWSVWNGVFYPSTKFEQRRSGQNQNSGGLSYEQLVGPTKLGLFVDFSTRTKQRDELSALSLGLQARVPLARPDQTYVPFARVGIANYNLRSKDDGQKAKTNGGRAGALVGIGIDSRSGFFLEIGYRFVPKYRGVVASGALFSIGYRF